MFIQTQKTPNPNSIKFFPSKKVSLNGTYEILNKNESNNELVRNILSINGVTGIFLSEDFLSVNKKEEINWDDLKHIIISFINEFYSEGRECVINNTQKNNLIRFPFLRYSITNLQKMSNTLAIFHVPTHLCKYQIVSSGILLYQIK